MRGPAVGQAEIPNVDLDLVDNARGGHVGIARRSLDADVGALPEHDAGERPETDVAGERATEKLHLEARLALVTVFARPIRIEILVDPCRPLGRRS